MAIRPPATTHASNRLFEVGSRSVRDRRLRGLLCLLAVLGLAASGCADERDEIVIGAEQEPACFDWIASCAGETLRRWGYWAAHVTTIPQAFVVAKDKDGWAFTPSDLLTGEPDLDEGPPQTVTYTIADDAVWSDGTPITGKDFAYTWDQIVNNADIFDTTGYADIEQIEGDEKVVVVTFKKVYPDWRALFGAGFGVLPAHLLEGKDRSVEMANGYGWSGGPWKIDEWVKGSHVALVPNGRYWGAKPKLDKVTFKLMRDTAAEFAAIRAGEVMAIYPETQPDALKEISDGLPKAEARYSADTGNIEALWFNHAKAPFDNVDFRKAVAHAIDRDTLVEQVFGSAGVASPLQTLNPPIVSRWADADAFSRYALDLGKVGEHMEAAGYTKGADGFWAKDGGRAAFTIKSTSDNERRELIERIMRQHLARAGIEVKMEGADAAELFGDDLPEGDFQAALYALVSTVPVPRWCAMLCSENIPTDANEFSGGNWQRVTIRELDERLNGMDMTLDENQRAELGRDADRIMAEHMVALPLTVLPNILVYDREIAGPVMDDPVMGPFFRMHEWSLRR